jgi:hypothetical protein
MASLTAIRALFRPWLRVMSMSSSGVQGPNDFAANPAATVPANMKTPAAAHHHDRRPGKIVSGLSEGEFTMLS